MSLEYKIEVPELRQVTAKMLARAPKLIRGLALAVEASGFLTEGSAKAALTEGPTRAIDTGLLRATTRMYEYYPDRLEAHIYSIVPYAIFVHEGTKNMRPRPYMKEALRQAQPAIQDQFRSYIREALA